MNKPVTHIKHFYRLINRYRYGLKTYFINYILSHIPGYGIRHWFYRHLWHISLGTSSSIHIGVSFTGHSIKIGNFTSIGRRSYLDGRGGLTIGNCVSVSPDVHFLTAEHDMDDPDFANILAPIIVEDYVWIGTRATILPGVKLNYGSVVATGAVVTKDVPAFTVVGGVPAKPLGKQRNPKMRYKAIWFPPFD